MNTEHRNRAKKKREKEKQEASKATISSTKDSCALARFTENVQLLQRTLERLVWINRPIAACKQLRGLQHTLIYVMHLLAIVTPMCTHKWRLAKRSMDMN